MKRKTLVFTSSRGLVSVVAALSLALPACGSPGSDPVNTMASSPTSTTGPETPLPPVTPLPTTPHPSVPSVPSVAPSVAPPPANVTPPSPATTPAAASSVPDTSSEPAPIGDNSDAASSGETAGSSSAPSNTVETSAPDVTSAAPGDEDFDPQPEDFACISDWEQIYGFRIHNFLGHTDEAKAVANNPAGGVYPVGTIVQHLPTEAMVKRRAGFSPETKDWEFFLLTLGADGTTTISERGPDIATAQGQACASCHVKADAAFDFVCNTWAENGGAGNCGFDFMQSFLDTQLASDTRCE